MRTAGCLLTTGSQPVYSSNVPAPKGRSRAELLQRFEVGFGSDYDLLLQQLQAPAEIRASFC